MLRKTPATSRRPAADSAAPIDVLPGLGPKSRAMLATIGINSAAQLSEHDPFEVYARLKAAQHGVSLNMMYGLIAAIEGRHWRDVAREDRTAIVLRLDDMGLM